MLSNAVILSALASTAAASFGSGVVNIANVADSQNNANARANAQCTSAAASLASGIPEPPRPLLTWLASYAMTATQTLSDACDSAAPTAMPESLTSAYTSYNNVASSWFVASSDDIASVSSACSDVAFFSSLGPLTDELQSCITGSSSSPVTQTSEVVVATTSGGSTFSVTVPTTIASTPTAQPGVPAAAPETPRAFGPVMLAAAVAIGGAAVL